MFAVVLSLCSKRTPGAEYFASVRGSIRIRNCSSASSGAFSIAHGLYAGHESEVPQTGDFLTRRVGGRPLIIVHSSDGQIRVFHNSCRHRGATVCRHTRGNARHFTCFYHNWTYDNQGRLDGRSS